MKCGKECEVYSRIVGYFRPVQRWNVGKKEEYRERLEYEEARTLGHSFEGASSQQAERARPTLKH